MRNGWTGGQLALVRALLGIVGCALCLADLRTGAGLARAEIVGGAASSSASGPIVWLSLAALGSLCFAFGFGTRWLAIGAACLVARVACDDPSMTWDRATPLYAIAAVFALAPAGERRAWPWRSARERKPIAPLVFAGVWIALAMLFAKAQFDRCNGAPLSDNFFDDFPPSLPQSQLQSEFVLAAEAVFVGALFVAPLRQFAWLAVASTHLFVRDPLHYCEINDSVLALLALAFDPAWIAPAARPGVERVLYDGACGLCHRFVRFVLAEDRAANFRFAPLGGATFEREVAAEIRASLPDSIVVQTSQGELLVRSRAVFHVMERLGGFWRVLAIPGRCLPRALCDFVYDVIARSRRRWFAAPSSACPLVPAEFAKRFES